MADRFSLGELKTKEVKQVEVTYDLRDFIVEVEKTVKGNYTKVEFWIKYDGFIVGYRSETEYKELTDEEIMEKINKNIKEWIQDFYELLGNM